MTSYWAAVYKIATSAKDLNIEITTKQANFQEKIYIFFQSKISSLLPPGKRRFWATFVLWRNFTEIWFQVPSKFKDSLVIEILLFSFRTKGSGNWDLSFNIMAQQMSKSWGKNKFQVSVSHSFTSEWKVEKTCL